jgi:hypothetical protein
VSAAHHAQLLLRLWAVMLARPDVFAEGDAEAAAAAFATFFRKRCSLDEAFGVRLDRGENHPGEDMARAERDTALQAAGAILGEASTENSKTLELRFSRYRDGPWKLEQYLDQCPANRRGQIEGHFWRALKALDRPLGWRRIKEILAAQRAVKSASDFRLCNPSSAHRSTSVRNPPKKAGHGPRKPLP